MATFPDKAQKLRPLAATAFAVLIPVLLLAGIYLPTRAMVHDLGEQLDARREKIARVQAIAEFARRTIADRAGEDTSALHVDFLSGAQQDSIVVADLQNRLKAMANANRVELNSANALTPRTADGLTYLGLHITMRGQLADIQTVLHTIETGSPILYIERASLRIDSWPMKSDDPNVAGAPAMLADLDVYGAKLPTSAAVASPAATLSAVDPVTPGEANRLTAVVPSQQQATQ